MSIIWIKIISLLIIFATGLITGTIPARMSVSPKKKKFLTFGNSFSGGVFLGAGLLHLLPDAIESFDSFAGNIDFPFPALICGIGFLFILLLEKAALGGNEDVGEMSKGRSVYPYLLLFVLSIHSIIAGTSLGLEATAVSTTALFIAIIAHKGAAAFALGISLKESGFSRTKFIALICFFSAMTPLGVILGTIFSEVFSNNTSLILEAVFDSLAAGTFLYVAIVDIINEVFEHKSFRWTKVFLIICGFCLMALIAIWA